MKSKPKILIVDDDSIVRRSLSRAFKTHDVEIFEAANGQEGVDLWREVKPDLVMLDVLMPILTGPQVLSIMSDQVATRVVMISAYKGENQELGSEAAPKKPDLYIPKPFENIFDVVKNTLSLL